MKTIYSEAKQQLSNCMLHSDSEDASPTLVGLNCVNQQYSNNNNSNNCSSNSSSSSSNYNHNHNNSNRNSNTNNHNTNSRRQLRSATPTSAAALAASAAAAAAAAAATATTTTTSAYDTLQRPFRYDKQRGRWSTSADFYFACTSHAFGSIVFSELPVYAVMFGGVYFLPVYFISMLLYGVPIFLIQTFLGQFSTSGTISAFRVAPIFKGIGYSILLLNLCSLAYYSVIAAVPLIYAVNSLHPVIPWMSCDNAWNTANCSTHDFYDMDADEYEYTHATVEFFRSIIRSTHIGATPFSFSWPIIVGVLGVWLLTLCLLLKHISFIGKCLRCACLLMFVLFLSIFVHLLLYTEISWSTIYEYFVPKVNFSWSAIQAGARSGILIATWLFGPGWGSVLTLGSYNSFRSDSERLSYWVSGTHIVLMLMAIICGRIALDNFEDHVGLFHFHVEEEHFMQFLYLCFAYLFGSFTSLPNFWSFLFFGMLFLAELSALVIQMLSVLTALFDEYEQLRCIKTRITLYLSCALMLVSMYFCTQQGFDHLDILPTIALLTHIVISLVLLLMATWIYGRERFQCDLQFMLGKTISSGKIFLMRFATPIFLLISILQVLFLLENADSPPVLVGLSQCIVYVVAFAYVIHKLCQTTGTLRNRLKQCFAPLDWHPVDADNRRFYEEVMGTSEMLVIDNANYA